LIYFLGHKDAGKTTCIHSLISSASFPDLQVIESLDSLTHQSDNFFLFEQNLDDLLRFGKGTSNFPFSVINGMIFFIDLTDPPRYPEVRMFLYRLLKTSRFKPDFPIAVFHNKADLVSSELDWKLSLESLPLQDNSKFGIFTTSSITPDINVQAFRWLLNEID